ncbi:MAG TPA: 50S ribosomal protein L1 [Candidatus Norongarragalinales archaeon]|nr:50S ribosomal protein L1 [Candidatus Norongarragalinales archaeon]
MERSQLLKAIEEILKEKGKRKFAQSIDLAINLRDVDFKKPENRVNVDVVLPNAPRESKVAVFADGQMAVDAKKVVALVIGSEEINSYATDKRKQKELMDYTLLSQAQLMTTVGKVLGQLLGAKGKLPKPIPPNANLKELVTRTSRTINIKTKGKYLPVLHCIVGKETMSPEQIADNIMAVLDGLRKKLSDTQIDALYIKLTMGKPLKIKYGS